jgi:hypothetical protein
MDKNTVLGKALYLEFRRDQYTIQLVFTPEAVDENGEFVPVTLMRRQISNYHPRKTWRFDTAGHQARIDHKSEVMDTDGKFKEFDEATAKFHAKTALQFAKPLLSQLFHQGWKLENKPFSLEYSFEDLALIRSNSTPQGLVRRILRSREALGFDKNLFATVE